MLIKRKKCCRRKRACNKVTSHRGYGFVNKLINNLPFELHLPGYNFCGPGTKLEKRLKRGDVGINPLDEACKIHDIAYSQSSSLANRHIADQQLAEAAEKRWRESNNLSEKLYALGVNKIMKFKVKRGMGLKSLISSARKAIKKAGSNTTHKQLINIAIKAVRKNLKHRKGGILKKPRVLPIPKRGGFLPLIPILSALAAAGSLAGGVSTAAKNIYEMTHGNKQQQQRTLGKGMYMAPYKKGMGLYFTPYEKKKITN